jgi:hypothetical protein
MVDHSGSHPNFLSAVIAHAMHASFGVTLAFV